VMPPTSIVDSSVALVAGLTWDLCIGPVIGVIKVIGIHGVQTSHRLNTEFVISCDMR
jgi:hypothetical protein